jgi:DNA-binding beta-propeller fold protein YncE
MCPALGAGGDKESKFLSIIARRASAKPSHRPSNKQRRSPLGRVRSVLVLLVSLAIVAISKSAYGAQNQELFVSDNTANFNETVLRFSATGSFLGNLGVGLPFKGPVGLTFDTAGNLYVANQGNNTILRYSSTGAYLGVFASAGLSTPEGVAFDSAGDLWACNYSDGSISRYSSSGALLAHITTGVPNPIAIALDSHDNIYISDDNQGPGTGIFRFAADGSHKTLFATGATLDPRGLAFDSNGLLYVANPYDNSIRRFASDGTDLGIFANTGLNAPFALAFDADGNLYVSNQLGGGIRHFSASGADLGTFAVVTTPAPANPVGLAFSPVPEPGSLALLAMGGIACLARAVLNRSRSRAGKMVNL